MTSSQPNILELSKQGDPKAIAALMNRQLQPKGITAKAALTGDCLQVILEAAKVPNQQVLIAFVRKGLMGLGIEVIKTVKVYGKQIGEDFPGWQEDFDIDLPLSEPSSAILTNQNDETPETLSSASSMISSQDANLEADSAQDGSIWNSCFGAIAGLPGAVGSAVSFAGGTIAGAAIGTTGAVGNVAIQAGSTIAGAAVGTAQAVGNAALQVTDGVGYVIHMISDSPQLQELTKGIQIDWLLKIIEQVDIVKAEERVQQLQRQYPKENAGEIAHRIMLEKALYVGGSGLASSWMPGFAAAMFAVDLAATTALQAEMGYQIACAYGLDLRHPARKGEILAIFGLALGGGYALKAGLGLVRNIPIAGAVIGASSNAAMLYSVGYAACHFYEAKMNPLSSDTATKDSQAESEAYVKDAVKQQIIMDQILAHVILAGEPGKSWQEILPDLPKFNLSPISLKVISEHIQSPPPLESLLSSLNPDFAIPLVAQCQKIVQDDGITTVEESKVLEMITKKFGDKISALQNQETTEVKTEPRQKLFGLF